MKISEINFEHMHVCQIDADYLFLDKDKNETRDFENISYIASFTHNESCEYILYIGDNGALERIKEKMSEEFYETCKEIKNFTEFNYICFYI